MEKEKLIAFLEHSGLVTSQTAEEIAGHFIKKIVYKNEFYLKEGKISNEYFFLESGFIRAFAYDLNGNDITTNFYRANQVVFEVSSFFNRTAAKENFQALNDTKGWYITYDQLNGLFHALPEFREFGRKMLVNGFAALKMRMLWMITDSADERYARLLSTSPEILRQAPLKHIASYLGITDTSLSRVRKNFLKKQSS